MHHLKFWKANLIYFVLTLFFLAGSVGVYFLGKSGMILGTEILLVLAPTLILSYLFKGDMCLQKLLRLNPVSVKTVILAILLPLTLYPAVSILSSVIASLLPAIPQGLDDSAFLTGVNVGFLVIGVGLLPGLCEELLFRGFLLRGIEKKGNWFAIIYVAVLFGIFHLNPYNFIGPFLLGILLGYLLLTSDSIIPGMIAHSTNNILAIIILQVVSSQSFKTLEERFNTKLSGGFWIIAGIIGLILSVLLFLVVLRVFEKENRDRSLFHKVKEREEFSRGDKLSFLWLLLPLLIYVLIIVVLLLYPNLL